MARSKPNYKQWYGYGAQNRRSTGVIGGRRSPTTLPPPPSERMSIMLFRKVLLDWLDKCPSFTVREYTDFMGGKKIRVSCSIYQTHLATITLKEDAAIVRTQEWGSEGVEVPYSDPQLEILVKKAVNDAYSKRPGQSFP